MSIPRASVIAAPLHQLRWQSIYAKGSAATTAAAPSAAAVKVDERTRTSKVRNIGIVAHIDAGKTTTTERILFYAGSQRTIGEVDRGTTTTDFLEEETKRGITITAAAVSVKWHDCAVNLIDTPGHVDFAIEVERSLRVLDGVVALFDAAVGVQAQSYTVLRMAKRSRTPVIAFINKMDKPTADFNKAVRSIKEKLKVTPLLLQIPLTGDDGGFLGAIDVVRRCAYVNEGPTGSNIQVTAYDDLLPHRRVAVDSARHDLIVELTAADDALATLFIEALDAADGDETVAESNLREADIDAAIRRQVLKGLSSFEAVGGAHSKTQQALLPIFCGASRRNMGVQPLMDAVVRYLPNPMDRPALEGFTEAGDGVPVPPPMTPVNLGMAFKVMYFPDPRRKNELRPLVFFRMYCGSVERNVKVRNQRTKEDVQLGALFVLQGNQLQEVEDIKTGGIGATFSDKFVTGDTVFSERRSMGHRKADRPTDPAAAFHTFEPIVPPSPVVSHAVEADTASEIDEVKKALGCLGAEDPSFINRTNAHGQLVVSGMGELHVEVMMSRMKSQFNVSCTLAKAIIEYREGLTSTRHCGTHIIGTANAPRLVEVTFEMVPTLTADDMLGSDLVAGPTAGVTVEMAPDFDAEFCVVSEGDLKNKDLMKGIKSDLRTFRAAAAEACTSSTAMGKLGIQMCGFSFHITKVKRLADALPHKDLVQGLQRVFVQAVREVAEPSVLEPVMDVTIILSEDQHRASVYTLLNERLATYIGIDEEDTGCGTVIKAVVPMRTIVKFSGDLRKSSKGNAHFWTTLRCYRPVASADLRGRILAVLGHK